MYDTVGESLIKTVTDLLMENGCAITRKGVIRMALFISQRERSIIQGSVAKLQGGMGQLDQVIKELQEKDDEQHPQKND